MIKYSYKDTEDTTIEVRTIDEIPVGKEYITIEYELPVIIEEQL